MANCEGNCQSCKSECLHKCPICGANAVEVPNETVENLVKETWNKEISYLCLNRKCEVVYFNQKQIFQKKDVKVPIWFKEPLNNMVVCYCRKITLQEIIQAVKEANLSTEEEIVTYLGKEKKQVDCKRKNPVGKECKQLFQNAIEYAKGEKA